MIHKHPSVCCLWNYGAKLHLNRRQICNFPCYSTPLISDQRYLTVIQSEQAHSRVCTHVWASTSSLSFSEMRHTSTHMPRVCLRGDEQQYFSTASVSAPLPSVSPGLPGLAATRDLFTCSFVAELYVCLFAYVCVCVFACSPVKQLPRSDSLLSTWHAWTSGFIVCFEFRSGRWEQHSLNWSAIFPRRHACVAS